MKKLLCFLTVLALAFSTLCIAAYAQEDTCGFAVASDIHYVHPLENADDYIISNKFGSNEDGSAYQHESGFIVDEFLRQCEENDSCDFILIPGDLATYGREFIEDHLNLAQKFRDFEEKTGKQVYVINGNHDNGAGANVDSAKFREIYYDFGYDKAFAVDESCCSYAVNLNDEYALIALDSCDENYSLANGVDYKRIAWVREQAKAITESGRHPILIMHHNLLEHMPFQLVTQDKYIVSFPRTYASIFADCGIKLVFTGHTHCTDAVSHTSPLGNVIYDFCTSSLPKYPLQYRFFNLTDKEISYEMKTVERIDTDALTSVVSGYTDEQISAMATDFPAYAGENRKRVAISTIKRELSAEGFGISEDSAFYNLINDACNSTDELFSMPLYGKGGVKELAKEYNIDIPDSDYETIWDIVGEVYLDFVAGNKNYDSESAEAAIVLKGAALALQSVTAKMTDKYLLSAANALIGGDAGIAENLAKVGSSVFGDVSPAEYFVLAVASPAVNAFCSDTDGVDNVSGTIPGYEAQEDAANIFDFVSDALVQICRYIKSLIIKMI